jgi:hypothetical protein
MIIVRESGFLILNLPVFKFAVRFSKDGDLLIAALIGDAGIWIVALFAKIE